MKIEKIKLAVFDFDSTLMDGETLEYLAKEFNIEKEMKTITQKAMRGEIDFFESLIKRVKLLEGLDIKKVNEICHNLPLVKGAKEVIDYLRKNKIKVLCFSGGFKNALEYYKKELKLDGEFSNILHQRDGKLTGLVGGEMMFSTSKGDVLKNLQDILEVTEAQTLVCGDGANDLSMFKYSENKIAFCAKPILQKACDYNIKEKDLNKIIELFD